MEINSLKSKGLKNKKKRQKINSTYKMTRPELHGTDFLEGKKEELKHGNTWWTTAPFSTVLPLLERWEKILYFPGVEGNFFFSCFEKGGTTLPFPEQFISLLDKTPCYIYPTKIADDILPAATLSTSIAHAPVNQRFQQSRSASEPR